jgi:flagellar hook-basal body complex protein FliE
MAYRGEDLDIRLGQGRTVRPGYGAGADDSPQLNGWRSRSPNGRSDPLYVDETVLACSNHAYDVAHAHGSSEVRLEHLLHAMTRVEAAAEILEQRGIREAHLRRESAAVISSDIPMGRGHSTSQPRASNEFSDVLRRASDHAAQRGQSATVHDLLWVLLNYNRDMPAIALLLRHANDWQSWDWPHMRTTTPPVVERHVVYTEQPRQRVETQTVYVEKPAPRQQPQTVYVEAPQPPPRQQTVYVDAPPRQVYVDAPQRRETLRETVYVDAQQPPPQTVYVDAPQPQPQQTYYVEAPPPRQQTVYMEAPRREREREPVQQPVVMQPNFDGIYDRIDQLEGTLRVLHNEIAGDRRMFGDLIREVQRDVAAPRSEPVQIPHDVIRQLENVELAMESNLETLGKTTQALTDKLVTIERTVVGSSSEGARNWAQMGERFKVLDQALTSGGGKIDMSCVTNQMQVVSERLSAFERGMNGILERLTTLDQTIAAQRNETVALRNSVGTELKSAIDRMVATQAQSAPALQNLINDRFQSLTSAMDQGGDATAVVQQIVGQVDRRHDESAQVLKALADRVVQIDTVNQDSVRQHERDLSELHNALLKLGSNQQTLSENLDQWRLEQSGDIGIISNRIGGLEQTNTRPIELLEKVSNDVQLLQRAALAEIDRDSGGFKHWLFGTNDIIGATWRNETNAVRQTLRQIRTKDRDQRA